MDSTFASTNSTVVVLGLGYVGCVTAACLAHLGHRVIGVDRDERKVAAVNRGQSPFYEPGLEELVRQGIEDQCLSATCDLAGALPLADIVLICVGTPSDRSGNSDLTQLRRVASEIARCKPDGKSLIVAVRSTVFPGTCEEFVQPIVGPDVHVVSNPEFLREGSAVRDFLEPSLIVVGGTVPEAVDSVAGLYRALNFNVCRVSLRTAEIIKYTCNAFHALKIGFANEIGTVCSTMGVNAEEVMATLCLDVKLNISPAYLKPGFAFGGSCLPKDLRTLVNRGSRMDLKLPLLEAVLPSNREHLERAIQSALSLTGPIGIYGLAFKENTDDLRESSVLALVEQLIGKGRDLRIYDPNIQLGKIYGSNLNFVTDALPHIGRLMLDSPEELLAWAGHVILAQKATPHFAAALQQSGLPVTDLTSITSGPLPVSTAQRSAT